MKEAESQTSKQRPPQRQTPRLQPRFQPAQQFLEEATLVPATDRRENRGSERTPPRADVTSEATSALRS